MLAVRCCTYLIPSLARFKWQRGLKRRVKLAGWRCSEEFSRFFRMALDTFVEERIRSWGSRLGLIETVIGDSSSNGDCVERSIILLQRSRRSTCERYWILICVLFIVQAALCLYLWSTHTCKNVKYPKSGLHFLQNYDNFVYSEPRNTVESKTLITQCESNLING